MIKNFIKKTRAILILGGIAGAILAFVVYAYLYIIPGIVASQKLQDYINKELYKRVGVSVEYKNAKLTTGLNPNISLTADSFKLIKNNVPILILEKIDSEISLAKIRKKTILIKKVGADYIYADGNGLLSMLPKEQQEEVKTDWGVDITKAILYINDLKLLYKENGVSFDVNAKGIDVQHTDNQIDYVHFNLNTIVKQGKNKVQILASDTNKVYIKNKRLYIEDSIISLNKSKIHLKGSAKDDKHFEFDVFAKNFEVSNIVAIIQSNAIIPNGAEMLSFFDNIEGDFDFKFNIVPKGIKGRVDLHHLCFLFIPVERVPIHIHKGYAIVGLKDIQLKDFSGYYGTRKINSLKFAGDIKDYMNTFRMNIIADGIVTNDFAKYYLSPVIGVPLGIVGQAKTRLILKSVKDNFDLKWLFKITPEDNLLVSGQPISPYKEERVVVSNMNVKGTILKIKDLNYYVTVPGVKEFYRRKLISLHGVINFAKGVDFRVMGFEISQPVPSEFLNIIIRQEIFKNGTAVGKLTAVDGPKGVKLFGNLALEKIAIPSQQLFLRKANLSTNFNTINIDAIGGYRRSKYELKGNIVNNIAFPIIINDIDFMLDEMDVEKLLVSLNQQGDGQTVKAATSEDSDSDMPTFDITNLIIKNCIFRLKRGMYNGLEATNMEATLTLDENGDLDLNSNRFDFAEGHSSCHACCDLKKHKYHVRLGVKDVNSDLIATALLNLQKEISGKASGIIDICTDDSLKLNGDIKFIVKDGTIGKIGLIEYVLNVASVFRNPLAMISPATIFDLMNIPDGKFNKIQGTISLKDNVIDDIKIKSFAQYLSAYIVGRYDLEKQDASLRVYTKFSNKNKGIYGILRALSLSNIASRVSAGARNDVNYYSAEIAELPEIEGEDRGYQLFVTKIYGDVEHNNFISSLKKLK